MVTSKGRQTYEQICIEDETLPTPLNCPGKKLQDQQSEEKKSDFSKKVHCKRALYDIYTYTLGM